MPAGVWLPARGPSLKSIIEAGPNLREGRYFLSLNGVMRIFFGGRRALILAIRGLRGADDLLDVE
ncbi:hypothetical protein D3C87_2126610 [compost metagenome]